MRIFHIATVADWDAALVSGRYTTSTIGRTLAEEGFIHASRGDQWQGVRQRYYADVAEPLVLLVIDSDLLTSPVVEEPVAGAGSETFPHVYGPIVPDAVLRTIPLAADAAGPAAPVSAPEPDPAPAPVLAPVTDLPLPEASFSRIYFQEMFHNLALASLVLLVVVLTTFAGRAVDDDWGPITGAALGLAVGVVLARRVGRRRATRRAT